MSVGRHFTAGLCVPMKTRCQRSPGLQHTQNSWQPGFRANQIARQPKIQRSPGCNLKRRQVATCRNLALKPPRARGVGLLAPQIVCQQALPKACFRIDKGSPSSLQSSAKSMELWLENCAVAAVRTKKHERSKRRMCQNLHRRIGSPDLRLWHIS